MRIRIGKASDNDYVLEDAEASRYHALLTSLDDGSLQIEDVGSTNGTFVNDNRIIRKKVVSTDRITFGSHYTVTVSELLHADNDYSEEFAKLKPVYEAYIKEKIRIQSSNQFKTRLFQSLPFALVGVTGIVLGFTGQAGRTVFILSFVLAVCAPTIGIYFGARQAAKIPAQLQHLANRFKTDYVCPKCGVFLGELPWESLANKKACQTPSCRAGWVRN
jgi:hypothetical protein